MTVLRVRIVLDDVVPEVWRLIEIADDQTLGHMHDAIQIAMGWTDSHLHVFEHTDGRRWVNPEVDEDADDDDERSVTLAEVLGSGALLYEYDLGDSWTHRLEVVETISGETKGVTLSDGARSAPPEDCGGAHGYARLLDTLQNPTAPDHDLLTGWLAGRHLPWDDGAAFDPEALDLDVVNRRLRQRFEPDLATAAWSESLRQVVERLTPAAQTAFGDHLERAELDRPVVLDREQAAACVRPFVWLLDRVGNHGLTLTSAGRLPPAVVLDAGEALGWSRRWMGAMNREDHVPAAANLREWATRARLVRKYRGSLLLTRVGQEARQDPVVLLRHLASYAPQLGSPGASREAIVLLLAELAVGTGASRDVLLDHVAFGLHLLGHVDDDGWGPPPGSTTFRLVVDVWGLLGMLGLVEDHFRDRVPGSDALARDVARVALQRA